MCPWGQFAVEFVWPGTEILHLSMGEHHSWVEFHVQGGKIPTFSLTGSQQSLSMREHPCLVELPVHGEKIPSFRLTGSSRVQCYLKGMMMLSAFNQWYYNFHLKATLLLATVLCKDPSRLAKIMGQFLSPFNQWQNSILLKVMMLLSINWKK